METNKYIKLLSLVIFSIAMSACNEASQDKDVFALYDDYGTYTQEQINTIQSAMDDWRRASNGEFCASIGEGASRIYLSTQENIPKLKGHNNQIGAQWSYDNGCSTIYLLNSLSGQNLKLVTLHELGHHFGCIKHFIDDSFIQANPMNSSNDVITEDILNCARNNINELY